MVNELHGCIPILCTPFFDDGSLDLPSLVREVEWVLSEGATGVVTLAIASEGYKLTESERDEVTGTVVAAVDRRVPVVVSADGAGTDVAIERAKRAEALGADALMVLPPYFVKPSGSQLFSYYRRIGELVSIPVMIQDAPQLTGVSMGPELWVRLAERVPTIQYVKAEAAPQGTTLAETLRLGEDKLAVFCGWGGLGMLDALERGASGSMPAPNFTSLFSEVQQHWEDGQRKEATDLFHAQLPFILWTMQSVDYSVSTAKEELYRREVFTSTHVREPAARFDDVLRGQLDAWLAPRLAPT